MSEMSDAQVQDSATPTLTEDRGRSTLLVIDDEVGPRQSLHMVFKDDYEVLLADGGPEAILLARKHKIDAAVLDIRMPGMSGVEVLAELKRIDPTIEVIMLTAYETIDTARQALRLGACDYLTKPFDLATMRTAVSTAMERHALSSQIQMNNRRLHTLQEELQNRQLQEEIVRTKGEIYASIIHDINGPLTIISGFVEIINQHLCGTTSLEGESLELIKDRLSRITRQVNSCVEISQRYLSFLRRQPGQQRVPVGARTILSDLRELLRVHPSAQKHDLVISPPEEDICANINGTDLIQILLNLTINALQCSAEAHKVEVIAERRAGPLQVDDYDGHSGRMIVNQEDFVNEGPLLAITVRDNGPGIPEEAQRQIFEPWFTTKPEGKGTGLGLAIVHRFVKENRGALTLETAPDAGTTFCLYLAARE